MARGGRAIVDRSAGGGGGGSIVGGGELLIVDSSVRSAESERGGSVVRVRGRHR